MEQYGLPSGFKKGPLGLQIPMGTGPISDVDVKNYYDAVKKREAEERLNYPILGGIKSGIDKVAEFLGGFTGLGSREEPVYGSEYYQGPGIDFSQLPESSENTPSAYDYGELVGAWPGMGVPKALLAKGGALLGKAAANSDMLLPMMAGLDWKQWATKRGTSLFAHGAKDNAILKSGKIDPRYHDTTDIMGYAHHKAPDTTYPEQYAYGSIKPGQVRSPMVLQSEPRFENALDLINPDPDDISQALAFVEPEKRKRLIDNFREIKRRQNLAAERNAAVESIPFEERAVIHHSSPNDEPINFEQYQDWYDTTSKYGEDTPEGARAAFNRKYYNQNPLDTDYDVWADIRDKFSHHFRFNPKGSGPNVINNLDDIGSRYVADNLRFTPHQMMYDTPWDAIRYRDIDKEAWAFAPRVEDILKPGGVKLLPNRPHDFKQIPGESHDDATARMIEFLTEQNPEAQELIRNMPPEGINLKPSPDTLLGSGRQTRFIGGPSGIQDLTPDGNVLREAVPSQKGFQENEINLKVNPYYFDALAETQPELMIQLLEENPIPILEHIQKSGAGMDLVPLIYKKHPGIISIKQYIDKLKSQGIASKPLYYPRANSNFPTMPENAIPYEDAVANTGLSLEEFHQNLKTKYPFINSIIGGK